MARGGDPNPFGPGLLQFLRGLARHNDREWFERHRQDYENEVREPALQFIRAMARHVHAISPHLTARDKKVGGSLMRVHRDVRFSKSKLPYKTNVGIQFRHEQGKDVHAPGLYVHIEPGRVFLGCGMWRPDAAALGAVRRAIDSDPEGWKRVRDEKRFRDLWDLEGESLTRVPRGYPPDHPWASDLKRKDHIALSEFPDSLAVDPDLIGTVAARFRRAARYLRWQAEALDLRF